MSDRESLTAPLCWLDLETTGTDEYTGYIMEIACVVTEPVPPFGELGAWQARVRDRSLLWMGELMKNNFVREMHSANGLIIEVLHDGMPVYDAELELMEFLGQHAGSARQFRLAGSGVAHFDRRWLNKHMPTASLWFMYAPLDVGAFRRTLEYAGRSNLLLTLPDPPPGKVHRAMPDTRRALSEFRHYVGLIQQVDLEPLEIGVQH